MTYFTQEMADTANRAIWRDLQARSICLNRLWPNASPLTNLYSPSIEPTADDYAEADRRIAETGIDMPPPARAPGLYGSMVTGALGLLGF